jgi:hypothetical protein
MTVLCIVFLKSYLITVTKLLTGVTPYWVNAQCVLDADADFYGDNFTGWDPAYDI